MSANPYAPPKAEVADLTDAGSDAEVIRQELIKHEASIKSIGVLYYLGGGLMLVGAAFFLIGLREVGWTVLPLTIVYIAFGSLSIALGRGIRAFRPWARITGIVLACIGLLGFPVGTLINGYVLYLLLSRKGKRIFEPDYPGIIAATPHLKYQTSIVVWVVLGLLFAAMVALIGGNLFHR